MHKPKKKVRIIVVPWLPLKMDGLTLGHTILVKKKFKDDIALLAHEERHVLQCEKEGSTLRYWRKYLFDRKYRMRCEAEAYAVSVIYGHTLSGCAICLTSTGYNLNLTVKEAKKLILDYKEVIEKTEGNQV